MDLELKKRSFLVTGASRGIGLAIANRLLMEGARVALVARDKERLDQVVLELRNEFGAKQVYGWTADCSNNKALKELLIQLRDQFSSLDGVIANVGDGRSVPDPIPDAKQWAKIWRKNFESTLTTSRVFLPMIEKNRGCMLFIASITGLEVLGAPTDYSTAKTAVIAFAQNLARKVAPDVRINVIAPGNVFFSGSSWEYKMKADPAKVEEMLKTCVPMQRFGTPEEIADATAFLCSQRASFITGSVLRVDGGQTLSLF